MYSNQSTTTIINNDYQKLEDEIISLKAELEVTLI